MEKAKDNFEINSDDGYANDNWRDISIFISQVNNHIYTQIYQNKIECDLSIEEENKEAVIQHTLTTNNIIDITAITKGKTPEEIALLGIQCLWTIIDISFC